MLLSSSAFAQTSRDKIAATYFFYWYDFPGRQRITNPDGTDALTLHPPDDRINTYSYGNLAWYQAELADIRAAGIDVALPVYWGDQNNASWAQAGLQKLVTAAQNMAAAGQSPPKIGMFLDTTSLYYINNRRPPDLTTAAGQALWYGMVKNFFTVVPRNLWATIDGRPLIVTYTSFVYDERTNQSTGYPYNQSTFDTVGQLFQRDFGVTPYLVREQSFRDVNTDGVYGWGSAAYGPGLIGNVATIGPGYDDHNVKGRAIYQYLDRDCGLAFDNSFEVVVNSSSRLLLLETWNEFYEGTAIAPTREYGRQYLDLTAQRIRQWKSQSDPAPANVAWTDSGRDGRTSGAYWISSAGDGRARPANIAGRAARTPDRTATPYGPHYYLYYGVTDRSLYATPSEVWITVEYLDSGTLPWTLQYDSVSSPYANAGGVPIQNTGQWRQFTFHITDAYFGHRENSGADFRIFDNTSADSKFYGRVWVSKTNPATKPVVQTPLPDLAVAPGGKVDLPLSAIGGTAFNLARGPAFASIVPGAAGPVLRLAPTAADAQSCPYVVTTVASNAGSAVLPDSSSIRVAVASAPALNVDMPEVVFAVVPGASAAPQTITFSSSTGSSFSWTASIAAGTGGNWATLAASTGTASPRGSAQVNVNLAGLGIGVYQATLNLHASGLNPGQRSIPMTLVISPRGVLAASPEQLTFTTAAGQNPAPQTITIANTGPAGTVANWTATAATTAGGAWLSVTPASGSGNGSIQARVDASALPPGNYNGTVSVTDGVAGVPPHTVAVSLAVQSVSRPAITGVINGASFAPSISAGSWVTIQGTRLATTNRLWSGADFSADSLPTQLDGVSVTVNGRPAYVYYISSTQLNVLSPDDSQTGEVAVQVTTQEGGSNMFQIAKSQFAPGLFLFNATSPAAVHLNGQPVGPAAMGPGFAPASPGETLLLFGTGFGPASLPFPAGKILASAAALANPVTVSIGGVQAAVAFAGYTSNGLVQLNITVPALPDGNAEIVVTVGGVPTPGGVSLAVKR